ncbi:hypothetical protein [Bernardetia sp.]|uniref:hypothetical protein n=1 Tax=Bernardetia sp. TaxID=1937974 RepID=UPI0025C58CB4|nr:hypothetical protein [Bernardetia sp.]
MIITDFQSIQKSSELFLRDSPSNPFYNKNVFFTQNLKANKHIEFQIIGNLGGFANDREIDYNTDYIIVSDTLMEGLKNNFIHEKLEEIQKIFDEKPDKYYKIKIVSESAFLQHIKKRCEKGSDQVTLNLINRTNE